MNQVVVLLAEDGERNRRQLAAHLKTYGVKVVEAEDGQEALDLAHAGLKFDILVTDYQMPNVDGIQLVQTLRQEGFNQPMILWTAWVPLPTCSEANAVVSKLSGLHAIITEVQNCFKQLP